MARNIGLFNPFWRMKSGAGLKSPTHVVVGHSLRPCSQTFITRPVTQRRIPPDSEAATVTRPP